MGSPQSEFPFSSCISRINRGSQANGRYRRVLSPNRLVHELITAAPCCSENEKVVFQRCSHALTHLPSPTVNSKLSRATGCLAGR